MRSELQSEKAFNLRAAALANGVRIYTFSHNYRPLAGTTTCIMDGSLKINGAERVLRLAFVAPTLVLGKLSYLARNKQPDRFHLALIKIWKNDQLDICESFEDL